MGPIRHDRSVCCCGRAVPLLWKVLEHDSATVAFSEYEPLLRKAHWILRKHQDIVLLRYLQGVVHKGRSFLPLAPLFSKDPEPCFASQKQSIIGSIKSYFPAFGWSTVNRILLEFPEMCQAARPIALEQGRDADVYIREGNRGDRSSG